MEINHEQIFSCIPPVAGSRPVLHLVESMEHCQETPGTLTTYPSIGAENKGLMDSLTLTRKIAVMLARRGYTVLRVRAAEHTSCVTIKAEPKCADLGGVEVSRLLSGGSCKYTMAVDVHGVQVEWAIWRPL